MQVTATGNEQNITGETLKSFGTKGGPVMEDRLVRKEKTLESDRSHFCLSLTKSEQALQQGIYKGKTRH